jgi:hypothetical protein
MYLYGKHWMKVEQHIGTRSGAQIRSHAQKFFNRLEKEAKISPDQYVKEKALKLLAQKKGGAEYIGKE